MKKFFDFRNSGRGEPESTKSYGINTFQSRGGSEVQRHVWDPSFDSGIHPDHCECTDLCTLVKARPKTDLAEITE
jgi:hypothetical protein